MDWKIALFFFVVLGSALAQEMPVLYDAYFGKPVTDKRSGYLAGVVNGTSLCTILVRPCRKDEGRRVDGTCTNPKHPSRGAGMSPLPRLLPARFGPGNTLRPARDGFELPSARYLRTSLIADGTFTNPEFSALATHVLVTSAADNVDLFYLNRYSRVSDCCLGNTPNRVNPLCIPIPVPGDDPYLRIARVRCLNLTRIITYQDIGCLPNSLPAERYSVVTPLLDLSVVYGYTDARIKMIRSNQGGELAFRMEGNREVPQGNSVFCTNNRPPEISCYNFGDDFQTNLLSSIYLTAMWFFREHNRIARGLAKVNPCWDDEKLFQTARQINIAQYQYIFYYELIVEFLGRKNALAEGLIYETDGYVNDFDPHYEPGVIREYIIGFRWFHNIQPGKLDLYRNGKYLGSRPTPDDELRSGILAINNTEADLTQGSYIQPSDEFDYVMAPDLAERYFGDVQLVNDLPATDIMRGRDAGLPPYNHYRKICGMKPAKHWEDFHDTIDKDKVEMLRRIYDDIDDVELMVAIYSERLMPGTWIGPTLYCIMVHNLLLWRRSDKFFFEHGDFPAALTIPQLTEVRKTSIARVLCDSGDDVKHIQPAAFFRQGPWNKPVSCKEIPGIDLNKWKDHWCPKDEKK
ncbi:peroxidase-like [Helicoverpa zea]|uniref:peroxidase-like n=1 Tax=Helicoverpa zea TaxID=7113 RepID=UPI001F55B0DE|nr:peroxidase-like [Helicoverpa zea]